MPVLNVSCDCTGEVCLPEPPRRTSLPSEKLVLSGQGFIVPGYRLVWISCRYITFLLGEIDFSAMLLLLRIVYEYCRTADDMPMLMTDVMSRLIEVFQVILLCSFGLVSVRC